MAQQPGTQRSLASEGRPGYMVQKSGTAGRGTPGARYGGVGGSGVPGCAGRYCVAVPAPRGGDVAEAGLGVSTR